MRHRSSRRIATTWLAGVAALAAVLSPAAAPGADPCDEDPCSGKCIGVCYINSHEQKPAQGVPVHWKLPIKYKINATHVTKGLAKSKVIGAVKAAIATWETLPCTNLKFQYAGESSSTSSENGHLLIYWGNSKSTWTHNELAWWVEPVWSSYKTGELTYASIGLNATPNHKTYSYDWAIGAQKDSFDVQTAVTWLLPLALGFDVSKVGKKGYPPLYYNYTRHTLCKAHEIGAQFTYFRAGSGCSRPKPVMCSGNSGPPASDGGGGAIDGGGSGAIDGGGSGDGAVPAGDGGGGIVDDDDGCCRVGHARTGRVPVLTLIGLGLLLLLAGRRRRR